LTVNGADTRPLDKNVMPVAAPDAVTVLLPLSAGTVCNTKGGGSAAFKSSTIHPPAHADPLHVAASMEGHTMMPLGLARLMDSLRA
jgi:hypothetical protein